MFLLPRKIYFSKTGWNSFDVSYISKTIRLFGHSRILYAENSNANEKTPNEKADAEFNAFMSICGE